MKICFIGALDVIHLQRLMKYLANQGHDIHIITYSTHAKSNFDHTKIKIHKIEPKYSLFFRFFPKKSNYAKILQVRKIIKDINPDILHGHFLTDYGLYTIFGGNKPKIIHLTGSDIYINWKKSKLQRLFDEYVLKKADFIISSSNHLTNTLLEYFNIERSKVILFPEGIDVKKFNPNVKPCFIDNDNFVVITTRRLFSLYNVNLLIEAIPYVLEKMNNVKFLIIGDGPEKLKLQKLSVKFGIDDHILFVGKVQHDDIPKWLTSADIYISTSFSDSLGLSNLEAIACGIFPIVTEVPAVKEYIKDGENGFIVPFDNPKLLAEKIIDTINNPNLIEKAKNKNIDLIKSKGIYENNVKIIEETYELL